MIATTISPLKLEVLREYYPSMVGVECNADLPSQPINSGLVCARARIDALPEKSELVISIENGIDTINHYELGGDFHHFVDVCYVVLQQGGQRFEAASFGIPIPKKYVLQAQAATTANYPMRHLGYEFTAGQFIAKEFACPSNNWMALPHFGNHDRRDQIRDALGKVIAQAAASRL